MARPGTEGAATRLATLIRWMSQIQASPQRIERRALEPGCRRPLPRRAAARRSAHFSASAAASGQMRQPAPRPAPPRPAKATIAMPRAPARRGAAGTERKLPAAPAQAGRGCHAPRSAGAPGGQPLRYYAATPVARARQRLRRWGRRARTSRRPAAVDRTSQGRSHLSARTSALPASAPPRRVAGTRTKNVREQLRTAGAATTASEAGQRSNASTGRVEVNHLDDADVIEGAHHAGQHADDRERPQARLHGAR